MPSSNLRACSKQECWQKRNAKHANNRKRNIPKLEGSPISCVWSFLVNCFIIFCFSFEGGVRTNPKLPSKSNKTHSSWTLATQSRILRNLSKSLLTGKWTPEKYLRTRQRRCSIFGMLMGPFFLRTKYKWLFSRFWVKRCAKTQKLNHLPVATISIRPQKIYPAFLKVVPQWKIWCVALFSAIWWKNLFAMIDADSHGVDVVSQAFVTKIHPELFQSKSIMNCGDKEIHLQMVYLSLLCFFHLFHPWPVVFICHRELVSSHLNLNTKNWLHIQKHYSAFLGTTPLTEVSSKKRLAALIRPGRTTDQWPLEPPFVGWFQGRTQDIYTCLKLHLQLAELRLLHPQVIEILSALPLEVPGTKFWILLCEAPDLCWWIF